MNSIFSRTSIREFTDQKVEDEKVEKLLRAAMAAPSAGNQQPWEFYVVTDQNKIEQLSKGSPFTGCVKNAGLAIVPCYRSDIRFPDYGQIDLSAATQNLLLEADELGLGAVWTGIAPLQDRMDNVRRVLDIPEGLHAFAIIPIGYPAKKHAQEDRFDEARIHDIK